MTHAQIFHPSHIPRHFGIRAASGVVVIFEQSLVVAIFAQHGQEDVVWGGSEDLSPGGIQVSIRLLVS